MDPELEDFDEELEDFGEELEDFDEELEELEDFAEELEDFDEELEDFGEELDDFVVLVVDFSFFFMFNIGSILPNRPVLDPNRLAISSPVVSDISLKEICATAYKTNAVNKMMLKMNFILKIKFFLKI